MSTPIAFTDTDGPKPVTPKDPLPVSLDSQGTQPSALALAVCPATDAAFALKAPLSAVAAANAVKTATSTAYEASRVVKAAPGTVFGVTGYNSNSSVQFIQLFDAASLPAEGAIPAVVIAAGASSNFSIDFGVYGRYFKAGVVICNSSTGPTKTIGTTDCYFDVRYV